MALVALATMGGTPAKTSAGKVKKVPPPAMAFKMPAKKAAMVISIVVSIGPRCVLLRNLQLNSHECGFFVTFNRKHFIGYFSVAVLGRELLGMGKVHFMRNLLVSMALALFGTMAVAGEDGALIVVELYTSEGCSSCPPADKMLTELSKRDDVLALALHVDYWDYLGWKDKFSMAKFTDRQEYYNMVLGSKYRLVTPQMIFQGQSYVAGARPKKVATQLKELEQHVDQVDLKVEKQGHDFSVSINPIGGDIPLADVIIVHYKPNYVTKVKAGENRGKTLNHTNIVTSWERVGSWNGERDWKIQTSLAEGVHAAVIVQVEHSGPILAARKLQ